jgi:hypothetical protein
MPTRTELRQELVDTLRENKLPQTIGFLHVVRSAAPGFITRPVGYCCLGVACKIAVDHGILPDGVHVGTDTAAAKDALPRVEGFGSELQRKVLPTEVVDLYGFKSRDGTYYSATDVMTNSLSTLNDAHVPFPEIANAIVRHQREIFHFTTDDKPIV